MPRLRLKDYLVIAGSILLIAVFTLALVASPAAAQTTANGPYYATPSWDQQLPAATRFVVLANWVDSSFPSGGAAVLDRETGLIWERSPSTSRFPWGEGAQQNAQFQCIELNTGNRGGWRLPTLQELRSLVDPTVAPPGPTLPAGHPFQNVRGDFYWSATSVAADTTSAWFVSFLDSFASFAGKSSPLLVWCVRGGHGVDPQ